MALHWDFFMQDPKLLEILNQIAAGQLDPTKAAGLIREIASSPLGFATLDHHRTQRCGVPEVIYAAGKSAEQVVGIAQVLYERNGHVLISRAEGDHAEAIETAFPDAETGSRRRTWLIGTPPAQRGEAIPVITAGTSDAPVAEEAGLTLKALGRHALPIHDVGVAGLHRLIARLPEITAASVIICIAGMEGALPSVLGGLVDKPLIAVPTSVGYGAAFGGIAALLGMLTSCASGITVVNIDNGFGAAYAAHQIARLADSDQSR